MDDVRAAMLCDHEAAKRLTDAGVLVPCWRCGGEAELQEIHTGGKPVYAVSCKKHHCGAYVNSDKETPHSYETEAIEEAERLLGPWEECMPKYLRRGQKEN